MKIKKLDIITFQKEYENEQNNKINNQLIEFDQLLISIFNQRKSRYIQDYY